MTDESTQGSEESGNPGGERFTLGSEQGNPAENTEGNEQEGSSSTSSYLDGLSEDNRKMAETKGWDDPNKVIQSYDELEKKLGSSLKLPGEDATDEDWNKLYDRLGRPKAAEDYKFKVSPDLPEDFPYDGDSAKAFASWAHEAGLNQRQAQSLHDHYVKHQADSMGQAKVDNTKREDAAFKALTEEWGAEGSEDFAKKSSMANAAMRDAGEAKLALQDAGLLAEDGGVRDARLAVWFAGLGERFFSEDTLAGGGNPNGGNNPFSLDADGNTNSTAEAHLIKKDPEYARQMIRAAGREKDFPSLMR